MNEKRRAPINTQREHEPLGFLLSAMAMGASEAIEHQEAQGQRSFVASTTLPSKCDGDSRKALEASGVKFGEIVEGDPMFQHVELPDGWQKRPTDHSMWSELVDARGRKRASIFYKAAFYDRSAHINAERRFAVRDDYDREDRDKVAVCQVLDCGNATFTTEPIPIIDASRPWDTRDLATAQATAWLIERYPNWQDAAAYWDEVTA